jgi:hypothetical protein
MLVNIAHALKNRRIRTLNRPALRDHGAQRRISGSLEADSWARKTIAAKKGFPACRICTPAFVLGTYIGKQSEREP